MNVAVRVVLVLSLLAGVAPFALAQAPNTAAVMVVVVNQTGASVKDAAISIANGATGARRELMSGPDGSATLSALPIGGQYEVTVSKQGFTADAVTGLVLRAGETATLRVKLVASGGRSEVTVYGTTDGVRADPQIGRRMDSQAIDETPILGRKVTSLPLFNSAFRQGKGTGDLFVNATYFITAGGSRRTTTFMVDGASNDEGWGRQTMLATVPAGAVQEIAILSNAFSAEFGWTAGPALNVVTKSGTNALHGEALYMVRPGGWQARRFSTDGYCAPTAVACVTPTTLEAINPADTPDALDQFSSSAGGPLVRNKTFFFVAADRTLQDRTTYLSSALPAFVLPPDGSLSYVGRYRQTLVDARVDHKLSPTQTLMVRMNLDQMYDTNPNDAVVGTNAPTVARRYTRRGWTMQGNHTAVLGSSLLNEARVAYLHGDPVTLWEPQELSTTYTRAGSVPFTIGESRSSDLWGHQLQFADTLSWSRGAHTVRLGGSVIRHSSGGFGSEPGTAILGTFTFLNSTTKPFEELTLADVQQYSQPVSYGVTNYELSQWMTVGFVQDSFRVTNDLTIDAGLRYDRQTLTDAKSNFAPRLGVGWHPNGDSRLVVRAGYAMYYTQIRSNAIASALTGGLDGLVTYTATPGQTGFPTCLEGACLPVPIDPRTLPLSQQPARNITIRAGQREHYEQQFAQYGLNFDLLPNYPDEFVNPRSQVTSVGVEREIVKGLFAGADYVHQRWTNLDRSVDLNAPTPFDRTAVGQTRSVAAANATRPIVPVNGGVRNVNVLMNLGSADYDGLQTLLSYRGSPKWNASMSYTLSKATNTTEPDGNGIGPNDANLARLGEEERGPSVVDQRHRAVLSFSCSLPWHITAGTVAQLASSRPFNATTGLDNNGDGANNDRPVVDGGVMSKSTFRGTRTEDYSVFVEGRLPTWGRTLMVRVEGFNLTNHGNILGRAQTIYGDTNAPNSTFGQVVSVAANQASALPSLANIDPSRAVQVQVRFVF